MSISDPNDGSAMVVTRVQTDVYGSSVVQPPFDSAWSELDRLRWQAGVVSYDTGMHVTVHVAREGSWLRATEYGMSAPGMSTGVGTGLRYREMQAELRGFVSGARAAQRPAQS